MGRFGFNSAEFEGVLGTYGYQPVFVLQPTNLSR